MKNYTAIALLSLSGIFLSATASLSIESPIAQLETSTAQYMLSAQTQQRGDRPPSRNTQRRDFSSASTETNSLQ
ncbi:hypothetical protein [Microcoleus sp. CAWBG640]|uniref:hypothetical protein n=1 Tax=Microcoleus sp. CAWBG640 TaxID=2841653 RepID=UPI00312B5876